MPFNQLRAVNSAEKRAAEVKTQQLAEAEQRNQAAIAYRESLRVATAKEACQRLLDLNPIIFEGIDESDWVWEDPHSRHIKTRLGTGWIYYYDKILHYFPKGMGYGGNSFSDWDKLSLLIQDEIRKHTWKGYIDNDI